MPTNLYGEGDNYELKSSRALPALMRKVLDVTKLRDLGWKYRIELSEGIAATYASFLETDG